MHHPAIVPPLPHNLQNQSFRGMDCGGWDFSGRDIRGCNFQNSNLHGADFTDCNAGRSPQQIDRDKMAIFLGLFLGIIFGIVMMTSPPSSSILTRESIDANFQAAMLKNIIATIILLGTIGIFSLLGMTTGLTAMTGSLSMSSMCTVIFSLMHSPLIELWHGGIIFVVNGVFLSILGVFYYRIIIKQFCDEIGTNFQNANLSSANFTNATLKNCRFDRADLSQTNLTNVSIDHCDRDITL
jgi:uncharacterized protein YjbI with pentapeptide repeats